MIRKKINSIIGYFLDRQESNIDKKNILLVGSNLTPEDKRDIENRLKFYCPGTSLTISSPVRAYFRFKPVLLSGSTHLINPRMDKIRAGIFNIDSHTNHADGWSWSRLAVICSEKGTDPLLIKKKFSTRIELLKKENLSKCYLFGTGPSLGKANTRDWSDGYRVVCNTIVRNKSLWNHIDPHFIVAGDAIYHFGHTQFAKTFRLDLALRLAETETFFVYPDLFDPIVQRELNDFSERLIPIPVRPRNQIHQDLTVSFTLPGQGNVLPLLLLPVGCTLSNNIFMWGFDGRAPNDTLFWSNSATESYPELLDELKIAHPAFFNHYVPKEDPFKYVKNVHGDILENCLTDAEKNGFHFTMMHHSWTPVLQKRANYDEELPREY
jgi:hypothetical protein